MIINNLNKNVFRVIHFKKKNRVQQPNLQQKHYNYLCRVGFNFFFNANDDFKVK